MASKLVLVVVLVFDIVAFSLAVAAEQRRAKSSYYEDANGSHCIYMPMTATNMGMGSVLFLMASQLIIMVASGCLCCGKALTPGSSRARAIALFVACWVAFFIAEVCLVAATVGNAYHSRSLPCKTLRKGVFGGGAAFIVLTGIVSQFYYVYYSKAKEDSFQPENATGLKMGDY